jgi:hypothetical protein
MAIASKRKKTSPHGIGPVSRECLKGMRMYYRPLKQLEDNVALREAAVVEREYRFGRYKNVFLPILMGLQKCHPDVLAGFAAMLGDLVAVQLDGNGHDAEHVRQLLKTAVIAKANPARRPPRSAPNSRAASVV